MDHAEPAEAGQRDGHAGLGDGVHGGRHDRDGQADVAREACRGVGLGRQDTSTRAGINITSSNVSPRRPNFVSNSPGRVELVGVEHVMGGPSCAPRGRLRCASLTGAPTAGVRGLDRVASPSFRARGKADRPSERVEKMLSTS